VIGWLKQTDTSRNDSVEKTFEQDVLLAETKPMILRLAEKL
jgi:hypothetical protein